MTSKYYSPEDLQVYFLELPAGKASLNLVKMARPSLAFELRNIVHKAQKSGESVRKGGLEIRIKK